jgi:hypothetical protein
MRFRRNIAVAGIAGFLGAIALIPASSAASEDAYAPLKYYAGTWSVVSSKGKTSTVVNTCARTGRFFVCEQSINGASKALVVFLPQGDGRYRTQTLGADGAEPGHWFSLKIKDPDWVYTPEGAEPRERTLNHYIDADHIHFDVQKKSGEDWKTTLSGDETRVK